MYPRKHKIKLFLREAKVLSYLAMDMQKQCNESEVRIKGKQRPDK